MESVTQNTHNTLSKYLETKDMPDKGSTEMIDFPKTLEEIKIMQSMNKYAPNITSEQRQRLLALEEAIKNKKIYSKSKEERARLKKLAKISNNSKRRNRK